MFPDDAEACAKHALDILNTAWIAVPPEFREPAKLLDPDDPLPHAVALMAKALWMRRQEEGAAKALRPPARTSGEVYDPEESP